MRARYGRHLLQHAPQRAQAGVDHPFGCIAKAGAASDLGRANLIAGANALSAFDNVGAELLHTFAGPLNSISLRCLQYGGGKWPVRVANARLIAMRIDRAGPLNLFKAITTKIVRAPKKPKLRPLRQILLDSAPGIGAV